MNAAEQYGRDLYYKLLMNLVAYTDLPNAVGVTPDTYLKELFPQDILNGEYRLVNAILDLRDEFYAGHSIWVELDYPQQKEYEIFRQVSDIWLYFLQKIEESETKPWKKNKRK